MFTKKLYIYLLVFGTPFKPTTPMPPLPLRKQGLNKAAPHAATAVNRPLDAAENRLRLGHGTLARNHCIEVCGGSGGGRLDHKKIRTELGGGFKCFLFSPLFGEDFQFDEHIFQLG